MQMVFTIKIFVSFTHKKVIDDTVLITLLCCGNYSHIWWSPRGRTRTPEPFIVDGYIILPIAL